MPGCCENPLATSLALYRVICPAESFFILYIHLQSMILRLEGMGTTVQTFCSFINLSSVCVTNPDPDLELTRDPPAPVLYWQPTQLPSYFRVHLDLVMTQQDLYLLMLFLWILFSD